MDALAIAMTAAWAVAAAAFAGCAASAAREVTYVTLPDGRRAARDLPLVFKLLLPFAGNFDRLLARPAFAARAADAQVRLVSAGFEGLLSGREFVALALMVPVALGVLWCLTLAALAALLEGTFLADAAVPLALAGVVLFAAMPSLWLRAEVRRRHLAILKALPFVLDVLTLSVEAGMDFIGALQRSCATRRLDPLNEELLRMTKEIQVGLSRKEALRNMADRVRQPDLKALAYALVQADELGVSIGAMLRIQSDQLRQRRFDRAEKLASEAPTKMLGPLLLCIFPAVFIILLGPVLGNALKGVF